MRSSRDEVIETSVLMKLALIAAANDRTVEEELNLAVRAYISDRLPGILAARGEGCVAGVVGDAARDG
ncbi:MAG: hypothetical protein AB1778_07445 [Candidatus Bipolaricaulota bacterium]